MGDTKIRRLPSRGRLRGCLKAMLHSMSAGCGLVLILGQAAMSSAPAFVQLQSSHSTSPFILSQGHSRSEAVPPGTDRDEFVQRAREGVTLFQSGQYRAAIDALTAAIRLEPDNAEAYYHRGIAYQRLESYAEALSDFTVAIEKGPPIDYAYLNRGVVRVKLGMMLEAESDFNAAIKIEPTRPDTYFNRAFLFLKTNRIHLAIDDFTKGIGFNPKDAKAFYLRASALETFHRHDEVRRDLVEALRLDPSLTQARDLLAQLDRE